MTSDTETEHESGRTFYTAVYRVRHEGREIGQTEQLKGSADVTGMLWDKREQANVSVGVFKSHKAAAEAVVKEWERRNSPAAAA
jgi:hypothetical protein